MEYAKRKRVGDKPLASNAVFAAKLGQMEMDIHAMRHVCRGAAREFDAIMRRPDAAEQFLRRGMLRSALTAKSFCERTGRSIAGLGSVMFGSLGYTRESVIDKLVRDVRHVSIIEGGDDVLRDLVFNRFVVPEGNRLQMTENAAIAVVGLACRLPGAPSPEAFWRLLRDGDDAIGEVPCDPWPRAAMAELRPARRLRRSPA